MYNFAKVQSINDKEIYSHFLENSKVFIYDENDNFVAVLSTEDIKNLLLTLGHPASSLVKGI